MENTKKSDVQELAAKFAETARPYMESGKLDDSDIFRSLLLAIDGLYTATRTAGLLAANALADSVIGEAIKDNKLEGVQVANA